MKSFMKYLLLFTFSGYIYVCMELLFRGRSDISMMFCASICVVPMVLLNNKFSYEVDFLLQLVLCTIFATFVEYIFGIIFNADYHIWDYRNMPFTQMSMPYHADGENCRLFTPEEITTLYVNEMTNLTHHQTYTNQMKMYINSLENKEDIESIFYGVELTGEYLDTYNMIMEQSKLVVQKYLETLTSGDQSNTDGTKKDETETTEKNSNDNVEETEVTK